MIIYGRSMDAYGEATGQPYNNSTTDRGWDLAAVSPFAGDSWSGNPVLSSTNCIVPTGTIGFSSPTWGSRQGDRALVADSFMAQQNVFGGNGYTINGAESIRLAIPGASQHTRLIHFAFSISALPVVDKISGHIVHLMDSAGHIRGTLAVNPSGRLQILDGGAINKPLAGNSVTTAQQALLLSSAPVISPETWYYLSIKIVTNAVNNNADITVYIGDILPANLVLSGTALALTSGSYPQIDVLGFLGATLVGSVGDIPDTTIRAVRDIVICDTTGTYNNALLGQVFVSAQEMRAEDLGGGWTAQPRENIGTGILDSHTTSTGLRCADAASLELGAGDFTMESFVRFAALPSSPNATYLFSKWRSTSGVYSYVLYYDGTDGSLVWSCSTDGTAVTEVKRVPWVPLTDHWYHVAVVRSASELLFFIDGTQLGVPVADANTYFNGTAYFGVGCIFNGSGVAVAASAFNGWMDETRLTVGVGRYTSDFAAPTVRFGRNSTDDLSFASVALLLGYDSSIADESGYARTITVAASNPLIAITPNDGANSYNVLNNRPAWDDTYVEAPYLNAQGILTFDAVPTATETVTVGATTYTWVAAVSVANDVKIGATIADCITNLIAAINAGTGAGTLYGTGTTANTSATAFQFLSPQMTVVANVIGASGNSVATTETMVNGYWGAATLTGGADIPADSNFAMEPLPVTATSVLGMQVLARAYKTDAGVASLRFDLIGPAAGVAAGSVINPDLNPSWVSQTFEQDPDTAAPITPSTIVAGRIRFKRTA